MGDFKKYKLGELYIVSSGLSKPRNEFGFGNPFITFKDVFDNFFLPDKLSALANTNEKEMKSCSVKRGDIFLTRTSETSDELGMSSVALKDYPKATFNGFTKRLRLKEDCKIKIDPLFIGYYFRSAYIRSQIYTHASMTTRASLNSEAINSIEISIPNIEVQIPIGKILKSLDNKIELNRRTNQTLEQLAQTLFNKYFVDDIDPINLPNGWRWGKLGGVSRNIRDNIPAHQIENGTIYIGLEHLPRKALALYGSGNAENLESNKFKFKENHILFGKLRPYFHKVVFAPFSGVCSTDILVIEPYENNFFSFCLFHFFSEDIISYSNQFSDGTRMPRINWENLANYEIAIPPIEIVSDFNNITFSIIEKIKRGVKENQMLSSIRDTLLPKLMSGEIDLTKLESKKPEELLEMTS